MLVAIASFGTKNLEFLRALIDQYQSMALSVDVVVLSEGPKLLPDSVKVLVGLPSKNPWSLPFAHKRVFAENLNRYDLFIYSEDDISVTERNIRAFVRATEVLADDEIAGFLRYETDACGTVWLPDVHTAFHWKPESVADRGGLTFAQFTNDHAAFYIVTREQLRRAISSGGFLREPYAEKYDMLCTAATDPYTGCGFRKQICVSRLDDFLVHHMSNRYAGRMGVPRAAVEAQIETLRQIEQGSHPASTLCEVESKLFNAEWSKTYDEKANDALIAMMPGRVANVLSIGCGSGATEAAIKQRGAEVTALPLDSIVGAAIAKLGITPVYGPLNESLAGLKGQKFDCVLVANLLHLQSDPLGLFRNCLSLVREGGVVMADSPNFDRLPQWLKRTAPTAEYRKLRAFAESGISVLSPGTLAKTAKQAGFASPEVRWYNHSLPGRGRLSRVPMRLGRITARNWVFRATQNAAPARSTQSTRSPGHVTTDFAVRS